MTSVWEYVEYDGYKTGKGSEESYRQFERCVEYDEYKTTRFTLCGFVGFEMCVEYDRH